MSPNDFNDHMMAMNQQQNLAPGTLPDGTEPLIFLDFENGVYTADGVPVALGDVVVENNEYGTFNPSDVDSGVGLVPTGGTSSPTLTGDALALVIAGSTSIFTFVLTQEDAQIQIEMVDFPDFNTYYFCAQEATFGNEQLSDGATSIPADTIGLGTHKIALTMIDGKLARSVDGGAADVIDPALPWTIAPNFLGMQIGLDVVLESIGLYPPQDDGDLPTLSAL